METCCCCCLIGEPENGGMEEKGGGGKGGVEEWVRSCVHNAAVEKASLDFIGTEAVPAPPHEGGGANQLQRSGAFNGGVCVCVTCQPTNGFKVQVAVRLTC